MNFRNNPILPFLWVVCSVALLTGVAVANPGGSPERGFTSRMVTVLNGLPEPARARVVEEMRRAAGGRPVFNRLSRAPLTAGVTQSSRNWRRRGRPIRENRAIRARYQGPGLVFDYRNPASRVAGSTARPPGAPGYRIAVASVPGLIDWKGVEYFMINRTGGWYHSVLLSDIRDKDDTDYIALGVWFWLGDLDNPHDRRRPHVTAVASGSNPFKPQRISALTAKVTYRGHAAGVYAAEEGTPVFRYFQAEARLTGDFKKGLVSGVLTHGTDTATGQLLFGRAKLKGVRIRDPARFQGPVDGAVDGVPLQGNWGGRFFSNPDVSTAPPGSVAGTFGALTGNDGKIVFSGSIAAYRQQLIAWRDLERHVVSR